MSPENYAQFEYHKMQLMGSLNQIANSMRECAAVADQFAQIIGSFPYSGNPAAFPPLANGQYPMPIMQQAPMMNEQGKKRKARGNDLDDKRRVKKPKDPNAPKRPASSYLLFQNDVRKELKLQNPGMRNNELLNTIAKLWSEMPQEQKDAYESRNKIMKDEWRAKKVLYESEKAGESGVPAQAATPEPITPVAKLAEVVTPAVEETSSSEESTNEDEEPSSDSSTDDDVSPPPKKSKKDKVTATPAQDDAVHAKKEKKHKKVKA